MNASLALLTKSPLFQRVARLCDVRALDAAANRIHRKYAEGSPAPLEGLAEHVAYTICRMPATFAAVTQALSHMREVVPSFAPTTILDIGSGPGTAAISAMAAFPTICQGVGMERSADFLAISKILCSTLHGVQGDCITDPPPSGTFDLMTMAYVINELSDETCRRWMEIAASKTQVLLIVEPGTPGGWARLMECRTRLIELGGQVLAPCPHHKPCPFIGTDAWCHESVRLPRSSLHRRLKKGELGYEDEKFCYLAIAFSSDLPRTVPPARIVHSPKHRHGHTYLTLCTKKGLLETTIISRKYKELYRIARDAIWGDLLPKMKEDYDADLPGSK